MEENNPKHRICYSCSSDNVRSKSKLNISDIKDYLDEFEKSGDVSYLDRIHYLLCQIRNTECKII